MKSLAKKFLKLFGFEIKKINSSTSTVPKHETYFGFLSKIIADYKIDYVLDVGASYGNWASQLLEEGKSIKIISFEPLQNAFLELTKRCESTTNWECENLAVGETDKNCTIHVSKNSESSSLMKIMPTHIDAFPMSTTIKTQEVRVTSIDSYLSKNANLKGKIFLKIDVQGYEKNVFNGSLSSLNRIALLQLELSLTPLYENEVLLNEWLAILENYNFYPIHFQNAFSHCVDKRLLQLDCIFLNGNIINKFSN